MRGRIISWSPRYGFIKPDDDERLANVFFIESSVLPYQDYQLLRRGDHVTFEVIPDPKHPDRVIAANLAWTRGAEPSLRELDRRAAREGSPIEWRERQRARRGHQAA